MIFIDSRTALLILKYRAKLEKLIKNGASYEDILQISQKLDNYILTQMLNINCKNR